MLIIGAIDEVADRAARRLVERGYRALRASSVIDAERMLTKRAVAAIALDSAVEAVDGARIGGASRELPIVMLTDPATVGAMVDDTLRYGNASG